ncbi:MAG: cytochrome b [Hyphomicrobiales bacterium]|nr:cytochrome b [Hyphomicrobiales bacterium]
MIFPARHAAPIYNPGLRALHWLMAALIFIALPLGVWASLLPRGHVRSEILFVHKSIGMTVLCLVALRIVWRVIVGAPDYAEPLGRLTHVAARSAHIALYALMIAMPVSGYVLSTTGGFDIPWFGLFSFPILLQKDHALHEVGTWAHFLFAWGIGFVLAAHLCAVIWHAAVRRDSVLTRMWPSYRHARLAGDRDSASVHPSRP